MKLLAQVLRVGAVVLRTAALRMGRCVPKPAPQLALARLHCGSGEVLPRTDPESTEVLAPGFMPALPLAAAADPDDRSAARRNRLQDPCR